jgi:signal recognition particle receptor subunit alpha
VIECSLSLYVCLPLFSHFSLVACVLFFSPPRQATYAFDQRFNAILEKFERRDDKEKVDVPRKPRSFAESKKSQGVATAAAKGNPGAKKKIKKTKADVGQEDDDEYEDGEDGEDDEDDAPSPEGPAPLKRSVTLVEPDPVEETTVPVASALPPLARVPESTSTIPGRAKTAPAALASASSSPVVPTADEDEKGPVDDAAAPFVRNTDFLKKLAAGKRGTTASAAPRKAVSAPAALESPTKARPKVMATGRKLSKDAMAALDYSSPQSPEDDVSSRTAAYGMSSAQKVDVRTFEYEDGGDDADDDVDIEAKDPQAGAKKSAGLFGWFQQLAGGKVLELDDLQPVLDGMRQALMSKNVASDISADLCRSITQGLLGKKLGTFGSVKSEAKKAMEEALMRILTPRRQVDMLHGIEQAKRTGRPYVSVFCGVNGVGKSTSLAKITNFLMAHGHKVAIVACDTYVSSCAAHPLSFRCRSASPTRFTRAWNARVYSCMCERVYVCLLHVFRFRAGAVEQLRTHARCLTEGHKREVLLYDQGYNKDAALVAQAGILKAQSEGCDVVLIDTAGRMQHNDNLMKALAKLIHLNRPDLVLFVGEALVGNDGVDQLQKFNEALERECIDSSQPRGIDGIVLTKFDTIDDKVGAAISMTYVSGQPIMFVGTGQTYADLKRMNAKTLIKALLK